MNQRIRRAATLRSRKQASQFTPIAVLVLALLANGMAIGLQREAESGGVWILIDIAIMTVVLVTLANRFHSLIAMPPRQSYWSQLGSFVLVTGVLSSAFIGPFTFGIVRWAAIVIGVPWALMLWLTLRELARLLRSRAMRADGNWDCCADRCQLNGVVVIVPS